MEYSPVAAVEEPAPELYFHGRASGLLFALASSCFDIPNLPPWLEVRRDLFLYSRGIFVQNKDVYL